MSKILVVDDESSCRTVLKSYLESHGYQVQAVNSGVEALRVFEKEPPDLVVSDVMMPEMDGFEFCRRLRATRSGQLVPFIFLSGQGEIEAKVEGHSRGGDDYLIKPFHPQELLAKIKAQLERSCRIHSELVRLLQQSSAPRLNSPPTPQGEPLPASLTPAEEKVFWQAIQGFTNKQISEHLFISPRTVQAHLSNIFNKLGLDNRSQLVRFALERGYRPSQEKSHLESED